MTLGLAFRQSFTSLILLSAALFIASCAVNTPAINGLNKNTATQGAPTPSASYQGRISLRVASDPPQALHGAFSINGDAKAGEMTLNSPLGNAVAKLIWTPQSATLVANSVTTAYPSTDALMTTVTGTTLPLPALFDWLAGIDSPIEGWEADLSNALHPDNAKLSAKRLSPLPLVELRIALEKP